MRTVLAAITAMALPSCVCDSRTQVVEPERGVSIAIGRGTLEVVSGARRIRVEARGKPAREALLSAIAPASAVDVVRVTVGEDAWWFEDVESVISGIEFPFPLTASFHVGGPAEPAPILVTVDPGEVALLAERRASGQLGLGVCVEVRLEGRAEGGAGPWVEVVSGPRRSWYLERVAGGARRIVPAAPEASRRAPPFVEVMGQFLRQYPDLPACLAPRGGTPIGGPDALAVLRAIASAGWTRLDLSGRAR